jgi:hypothetical protein
MMLIKQILLILSRIGVTGSQSGLRTPAHLVPASGHETPLHYATEGTPANFSRCDSLSSLDTDDEVHGRRGKGYFSNRFVALFVDLILVFTLICNQDFKP